MQQTSQPKPLKSPDQTETDTSTTLPVVVVRPATEADVSFIFNSWLKSYRGTCKAISNPVYYQFQHKTIEAILQRSQVLVACDAADPNQLYGYLVYEVVEGIAVVHYAYIKHSFRGMKLLSLLAKDLPAGGGYYTHDTANGHRLAAAKKFVLNPYLVFGVK